MNRTRRFESLEAWLSWLVTLHPKQIDMSLGRVEGVLAALGISKPSYRIVTVGGTNGKGSCVALLERIYLEAGYRVGAFTSPHLIAFNERIRTGGQDIDDASLIEVFEIMEAARGELTLSYFEASAVAALLHFARAGVDVAVLEVGMGGRLDAVNAVDADCALIVSVDLDHMEYLGTDRDAIGYEKAGIVRAGRPAVVADRDPPRGLMGEIGRRGAVPLRIGVDFDVEAIVAVHGDADGDADGGVGSAADGDAGGHGRTGSGEFGAGLVYRQPGRAPRSLPRPGFGGRIQIDNAAAVITVVDALAGTLPVDETALARGLARARVRGRFDHARVGRAEWLFDVAHNPAAARLFRQALDQLPSSARTIAVFGAMRDKDLEAVLAPFVPIVEDWFVGGVDSDRGASPAEIGEVLAALGARRVACFDAVAAATLAAQASDATRVLAFGSFYTVGPAMQTLGLY